MKEEELRQRGDEIFAFIESKEYRPMRARDMAALFCVPKKQRGDFHEVLDYLVAQGKIEFDKKGLIGVASTDMLVGRFMATLRGFGFVRVEGEDDDYFISEKSCGNAFHGDTVQIHVTKKKHGAGKRKEAVVVKVLERATTTLVGTFTKNKKVTFVIPDFEKFPDIYIPKGGTMDAVQGHKVLVELTSYGDSGKSPEGIVTRILGHAGDPGVDILSVIKGFGIPEEFPEDVWNQLKQIPDEVSSEDYAGRVDLRGVDTVTIDGEDAKDLDDAITIHKNGKNEYELGVHIADVSHYVTEGSALDKEAIQRGTSVYLVDRVIPMLPHKLSNGICSLNAGEDRLALSCMMTIDRKGKVVSHRIAETVIRVTERMSYNDVNDILTYQKEETCKRYETLIPMFETMKELAAILRKQRKKQGSIDFDFPECKIHLDEKGKPIEIVPYDRNVATKIIEEFMLIANKVVAEEYFWLEIPFLYRTHEYPDLEKIRDLARMTAGFGYHMKVGKEEVHPKEIQRLIEKMEGTKEEAFLSRLTLRAMKRAQYSTVNEGHFGLATQYYCHFTSPIRRYPDLQIHRIIKENIRYGIKGRRYSHYEEILPEIAKKASDYERRADDAEREVEKMKKTEYMLDRVGNIYSGVISGVTSWGIYVELPNTVEGMVRLADMQDDRYVFEEDKYRVIGHRSGRIFQMGQAVKVVVENVDLPTRNIDFAMVLDE
ncbi:MAG: ribonuclease R [Eubacterium sp.]|nr:ribonuclease R [Eubacterium sp.]